MSDKDGGEQIDENIEILWERSRMLQDWVKKHEDRIKALEHVREVKPGQVLTHTQADLDAAVKAAVIADREEDRDDVVGWLRQHAEGLGVSPKGYLIERLEHYLRHRGR